MMRCSHRLFEFGRAVLVLVAALLCSSAASSWALTLSGRCVDASGAPVRAIKIYISGQAKPVYTNANGVYSASVSGSGEYTVTPYPTGNRAATPVRRTAIVSGASATGVDFEVTRLSSKVAVRGRVLDAAGGVMPNTEVYISNVGRVATDANGIFVVANLDPKRYVVTPYRENYTFSPSFRSQRALAGQNMSVPMRGRALPQGVSVATYVSGVFDASLRRTSGTCPILPETVEGVAAVGQRDQRVTFYLPRLGSTSLDGEAGGFSGSFRKRKLLCLITGDVGAVYQSHDSAEVSGSLRVVCLGTERCNGTFAGTMTRR